MMEYETWIEYETELKGAGKIALKFMTLCINFWAFFFCTKYIQVVVDPVLSSKILALYNYNHT